MCVSRRWGRGWLCKEVDEQYLWGGDPERWPAEAKDTRMLTCLTVSYLADAYPRVLPGLKLPPSQFITGSVIEHISLPRFYS